MMAERVPRACCLGVRAGDLRIHASSAAMVPEDAADRVRYRGADPGSKLPGRRGGGGRVKSYRYVVAEPREHEVTLDGRLLREVCGAVWLPYPGGDAGGGGAVAGVSAGEPEGVDGERGVGGEAGAAVREPERGADGVRVEERADRSLGSAWRGAGGVVGVDVAVAERSGAGGVGADCGEGAGVEAVPGGGAVSGVGCGGARVVGRGRRCCILPTGGGVFLPHWAERTRRKWEAGEGPGEDEVAWRRAWSAAFDEADPDGPVRPATAVGCHRCVGMTSLRGRVEGGVESGGDGAERGVVVWAGGEGGGDGWGWG